jgi:hypothetical protein
VSWPPPRRAWSRRRQRCAPSTRCGLGIVRVGFRVIGDQINVC